MTSGAMEKRSVTVLGLTPEISQTSLSKYLLGVAGLMKTVRVIGPDGRYTGKVYAVYESEDKAKEAIRQLTKETVHVTKVEEKDRAEFEEYVTSDAPDTPNGATQFLKQWQSFSSSQQQMLMRKMNVQSPMATSPAASVFFRDQPVVLQEKAQLSNFSGSSKDSSFGKWKFDVKCLRRGPYTETQVLEAVRKSLRSPASDILPKLGIDATVEQILYKLQSVYGSVLPGEALLEKFYTSKQDVNETCAAWSQRLENLIFEAVDKEAIIQENVEKTLSNKFWSGLCNQTIKDSLRHRYKDLVFEDLLAEARVIEEERKQATSVKQQQMNSVDDSNSELMKMLKQMQMDIELLKKGSRQEDVQTSSKTKGPVRCTKCKLEGHWYWGCRKDQDIICRKCQAPGHVAKSCRNPKAEN